MALNFQQVAALVGAKKHRNAACIQPWIGEWQTGRMIGGNEFVKDNQQRINNPGYKTNLL